MWDFFGVDGGEYFLLFKNKSLKKTWVFFHFILLERCPHDPLHSIF